MTLSISLGRGRSARPPIGPPAPVPTAALGQVTGTDTLGLAPFTVSPLAVPPLNSVWHRSPPWMAYGARSDRVRLSIRTDPASILSGPSF